jgi:GDPmannose 4,6-dehydratase
MKKKIALITGISGQDGAYLAKFLLSKKYTVIGTDRRSARSNFWRLRRLGIENKIQFEEMELSENCEIDRLFKKYKNIQEVYNLAAQSFVATSFKSPVNTSNVTALGPLRILEAIRNWNPKIKFYQASSSEMYGDVLEKYQNEKTPFNPRSPYSCAKVFAHYITKNYRESYNMFAVSGILFNHESPLRGEEFVTRKITLGLIKILNGDLDYLELGNINAKRDWGFAGDYVELMWAMLQKKKPKDYVVATGKDYSIKEFVNECLKILKIRGKWIGKGKKVKLINLENKKTLIKINPKFFRPAEVNVLHGDSSLAHHELGWKPKVNLKKLVKMMIDEEIKFYNYN